MSEAPLPREKPGVLQLARGLCLECCVSREGGVQFTNDWREAFVCYREACVCVCVESTAVD